jgi:diguanylate cyclase (GGDEF)-like protein/PAS domain S-box-containing protein
MPEAVAKEHRDNDLHVIARGERTSFEEHNKEADGIHYYLTVKCPVYGEGEIIGVVGISTDISERKKDEERLKLAAAVLRSTGEGVVITDVHSDIVAVNRAFTEITGYEEAEVLGRNPSLLKSERQPPAFYEEMWRTLLERDAWQGEIWNRQKNGAIFPEWLAISAIRDGEGTVTHFVGVFSDISTLKHSQQRLEHLAHFDPLTDLPNRALFQDRLAHAIDRAQRYGHQIGVMILDLDGFKTVNDSLGHPVGDQLLVQVAGRLQQCIRVEDTVARLGGDEFAIILSSLHDGSDAVEVVRKILASIEQPFDLSGVGAMISTSIGVASFPQDGASATELVRNADAAMYGAKEGGRNTYRFYQAAMTQHAQDRLQREAALRLAIEGREFEVWFQPQLHLRSGNLVGAEALVRWRDPARGLVMPNEFIPLAERTGLVLPIGEWVLGEVCRLGSAWLADGFQFGRLAVNVAAPQIDRGDFVGVLREALASSALPPEHLEIEITESLIMTSAATARPALQAVRQLGVATAVDDFGTGYSSLAYLKELPIDKLKIDRAFVKDLPDDPKAGAITRAIIGMAHSLGYEVIAEGIETVEQCHWLHGEGCSEGQGYWFARPMPAADFAAWMRERKGAS